MLCLVRAQAYGGALHADAIPLLFLTSVSFDGNLAVALGVRDAARGSAIFVGKVPGGKMVSSSRACQIHGWPFEQPVRFGVVQTSDQALPPGVAALRKISLMSCQKLVIGVVLFLCDSYL